MSDTRVRMVVSVVAPDNVICHIGIIGCLTLKQEKVLLSAADRDTTDDNCARAMSIVGWMFDTKYKLPDDQLVSLDSTNWPWYPVLTTVLYVQP